MSFLEQQAVDLWEQVNEFRLKQGVSFEDLFEDHICDAEDVMLVGNPERAESCISAQKFRGRLISLGIDESAVPKDDDGMSKVLRLADKNFDGIIQKSEFVISALMCEEAMDRKHRILKSRERRWTLCSPKIQLSEVRVFSVPAFMEVLCKMGINYLNLHGSDEQAKMSSGLKVIWTVSYLAAKFNAKVGSQRDKVMAERAKWRPKDLPAEMSTGFRRGSTAAAPPVAAARGDKSRGSLLVTRREKRQTIAKLQAQFQGSDEEEEDALPKIIQRSKTHDAPRMIPSDGTSPSADVDLKPTLMGLPPTLEEKEEERQETKRRAVQFPEEDEKVPKDPEMKSGEEYLADRGILDAKRVTKLLEGKEAGEIPDVKAMLTPDQLAQNDPEKPAKVKKIKDRQLDAMKLKAVQHQEIASRAQARQASKEIASRAKVDLKTFQKTPNSKYEYVKPLDELVMTVPELFSLQPEECRFNQAKHSSKRKSIKTCACGFDNWKKWGNPRCFKCSNASLIVADNSFLFVGIVDITRQKHAGTQESPEISEGEVERTEEIESQLQGKVAEVIKVKKIGGADLLLSKLKKKENQLKANAGKNKPLKPLMVSKA